MANAAAIHAKVAAAARKHGGAATLKRVLEGTRDDATDETTPPAELTWPCYAVWFPTSGLAFVDGTMQRERGEKCLIAPSDFPAGVAPQAGDTLTVDATGEERHIRRVTELRLDGANVLYYDVVV